MLLLFVIYSSLTEELGSLDHFFIVAVFYTLLIFIAITDTRSFLARFFRLGTLLKFRFISYAIYLFHQLVNGVLHDDLFTVLPSFKDVSTVAVQLLAFLVTCLIAMGTYHAFEKRFVAIGHKSQYAPQAESNYASVVPDLNKEPTFPTVTPQPPPTP